MSVMQGSPDWLKAVPGAAKSVANTNYSDVASATATIGIFSVQAYRAIAVQWTPLQSQYLTVLYADDPAVTSPTIRRTFTAVNPAQGLLTIPALGAYASISVTRIDGANNPTGHLNIVGVSSADRNGAARGPAILRTNLNVQANAGATVQDNCVLVAEGLASVYWRCTGTAFVLQIQALDTFGSWNTIAEATNTDISPARFTTQVPGQQLRLNFTNSDGVLRAVGWMIVVGD